MPIRIPDDDDIADRLASSARETRRLWRAKRPLDVIELAIATQEVADDLIREAVGAARAQGVPWEGIATRLGATRQAAWQKFNFSEEIEPVLTSGGGRQGRQAYFRALVMKILRKSGGGPVVLDDLYEMVARSAEPGWVDDAPCRHNKAQREWQHDLRWSLLQLKAGDEVRQPARGMYAIA